ncbi:hypothetical protein JDV02_010344 [Purpureocillium takamizusanense]|uniref:Uncharacterized protein n=1 Tax=Purpureocillium takamizusanense TaxID=2060973 RepID=A0A9Q8QNR9_9HYPO|nr:uncharacterized protein JDV02_010344 [Purpureocillium takamizusanense]UNI24609.1 hypothetical protein JDV02_010344 [Purpureocillium takamizusanense]
MVTRPLLLVFLAAVLTGLVGTRRTAADFVHPPPFSSTADRYQDNPRYEWGKNITVEWKFTTPNETDLVLGLEFPRRIEHPDDATYRIIYRNLSEATTSMPWNVTLIGDEDLVPATFDAICYLVHVYAGTTLVKDQSAYFNVSLPRKAAPSPTTITTTAAVSTPTPTRSTAPSSTGGGGGSGSTTLSHGAAAGIGVGVTLAVLVVLGGLGFLLWRRWQRRRDATHETPGDLGSRDAEEGQKQQQQLLDTKAAGPEPQEMGGGGGWEKQNPLEISELDGGQSSFVHEKP